MTVVGWVRFDLVWGERRDPARQALAHWIVHTRTQDIQSQHGGSPKMIQPHSCDIWGTCVVESGHRHTIIPNS